MDVNISLVLCAVFAVTVAVDFVKDDKAETFKKANVLDNEVNLLRRLETNERLVKILLERVDYLETREKEQRLDMQHLHKQLGGQKRRTSMLEKLVRRQNSGKQPEDVQTKNLATEDETEIPDGRIQAKLNDNIKEKRNKHNRIRRAENETPIAFFATITNAVTHAGVSQSYVFNHAITNLGNAYNNHNGNFIAPVDGTYVFSVTLMSRYHINAHARFFKNGQSVSLLYVSGAEAGYDTTSQTIILQLHKGDDVSVRNMDADNSMAGSHYSTFAGFLLQQDYSTSVVVGRK